MDQYVYPKSDVYVILSQWLLSDVQRFKDDSFCNSNLRNDHNGPDYFDDNEESSKPYGFNFLPSPIDAIGIPEIQSLE